MKNFQDATFCFLGRSGSGKDTQAKLLKESLEQEGYKIINVSTGDKGRALRETNTIVGRHVKKILDKGSLFNDWLAISLWMCVFQDEALNEGTIIFPSSPRYIKEAQAIDELMVGSGRSAPTPIYIDISNQEATQRLLARGRADDTNEVIAKRLSWFDGQILEPIVNGYYKERILKISGVGREEEIHKKILHALEVK